MWGHLLLSVAAALGVQDTSCSGIAKCFRTTATCQAGRQVVHRRVEAIVESQTAANALMIVKSTDGLFPSYVAQRAGAKAGSYYYIRVSLNGVPPAFSAGAACSAIVQAMAVIPQPDGSRRAVLDATAAAIAASLRKSIAA